MSIRKANSRDSLTITLQNALLKSSISTEFNTVFSSLHTAYNAIDGDKLKAAIVDKYYLQDINIPSKGVNKDYTNEEIMDFITDVKRTLELKAPYYAELIENYNKAYDYATGNKRRTERYDNWHRSGEKHSSGGSDGEHTEYELPNKVVATTYKNTPSSIDTDNGNSHSDEADTSDTSGSSVNTVIYDNEFLDLKRKYLAQIRNVYEEYADEIEECFYSIYYTDGVKEDE